MDDSLRHAITKLSHLHFPATRQSEGRIRRLGEDAWRIVRAGTPGLDGIVGTAATSAKVRAAFEQLKSREFALLVLHPATPDSQSERSAAQTVLAATRKTFRQVAIYPNNDPGSAGIAGAWDAQRGRDENVIFCRDLPRGMFLGLLRDAAALIGNSSAGIIEAASFGTPVLDLGPRQTGREAQRQRPTRGDGGGENCGRHRRHPSIAAMARRKCRRRRRCRPADRGGVGGRRPGPIAPEVDRLLTADNHVGREHRSSNSRLSPIKIASMSTAATMIPAAPADSQARIAALLSKVTMIAALPEVTSKIIATVENPRSDAGQLRQIVAHDPALVSRVLKVVNSSFYGLPGQVASVERAIVLLGLNAVKNLAIAASLGQLFRGARLCQKFSVKDLWTHCVAVSVTARELAKQMKLPLAEEAFLGGMIHDVGLLVLLQSSPEQLREVCESASKLGGDFCANERSQIGVDHQQVGMALAAQWKFPKPCQLVAGYHHQPMAVPEENRTLVALVWAADTICCRNADTGCTLTASADHSTPPRSQKLHLDPAAMGCD